MPPAKFVGPRLTDDVAAAPAKVKKTRQPKQKPADWTNAEWARDIARRAVLSADRRTRETKAKAKAAIAVKTALEKPRQHCPGVWGSQGSVSSPTSLSPSSPAVLQEGLGQATPLSRFSPSPEYADGDPLGGFNPNIAFPRERAPGFNADLNVAYAGSPAYRRVRASSHKRKPMSPLPPAGHKRKPTPTPRTKWRKNGRRRMKWRRRHPQPWRRR